MAIEIDHFKPLNQDGEFNSHTRTAKGQKSNREIQSAENLPFTECATTGLARVPPHRELLPLHHERGTFV
jgi:hypothetical protein